MRGLEAVHGTIYRLDISAIVILEILKDGKLRRELEEALTRLAEKVEVRGRRGGRS